MCINHATLDLYLHNELDRLADTKVGLQQNFRILRLEYSYANLTHRMVDWTKHLMINIAYSDVSFLDQTMYLLLRSIQSHWWCRLRILQKYWRSFYLILFDRILGLI